MLTLQKTGRIRKFRERPERFVINRHNPLYGSLVFANLGQMVGANKYRDSSTHHNDGTLTNYTNPTTSWSRALGRPILKFNGSNNYVLLNYALIAGSSQYSIAFWAYGASYPGAAQPCICLTTSLTGTTWYFYPYDTTNNGPRLYTEGGGGGNISQFSVAGPLGWNHFCITQSASNLRSLYINGAYVTSATYTFSFPSNNSIYGYSFTLGGSFQRYVQYSPASLADVIVSMNVFNNSIIRSLADPSNVMLDTGHGKSLIIPSKRKLFTSAFKSGGSTFGNFISTFW